MIYIQFNDNTPTFGESGDMTTEAGHYTSKTAINVKFIRSKLIRPFSWTVAICSPLASDGSAKYPEAEQRWPRSKGRRDPHAAADTDRCGTLGCIDLRVLDMCGPRAGGEWESEFWKKRGFILLHVAYCTYILESHCRVSRGGWVACCAPASSTDRRGSRLRSFVNPTPKAFNLLSAALLFFPNGAHRSDPDALMRPRQVLHLRSSSIGLVTCCVDDQSQELAMQPKFAAKT